MVDVMLIVVCLFLWTVSIVGAFLLGWWVHTKSTGEVSTEEVEEEATGRENIQPRWNPGDLLEPYTSAYQESEWAYAEKVNKEESI